MIAYKIKIDGSEKIIAGFEDWAILNAIINSARANADPKDKTWLSVGGLSKPDQDNVSYHCRWSENQLKIGSKIEIEIIETDKTDSPIKRFRSDKQIKENPFTEDELRQLRYESYLELKNEFEPNKKQPSSHQPIVGCFDSV